MNDHGVNQVTVHTSAGCSMPVTRNQTGTTLTQSCSVYDNYNSGCGVGVNKANSYGPAFNAAGGGYLVLERQKDNIQSWFWSRNDSSVPAAITGAPSSISSVGWGLPVASFPSTSTCSISDKFGVNNIIFDLTFCGDYAGTLFTQQGCGQSCVDYVNNNPSAFANAYWTVNAVRVYT